MSDLEVQRKQLQQRLATVEQETKTAWTQLEEVKKETAGKNLAEDNDAFEKLDTVGKAYDEKVEEYKKVQARLHRIWEMESTDRQGFKGSAEERIDAKDAIHELIERKTPGQRLTESDEYKALVKAGAFAPTTGKIEVKLGEAATRAELKAVLSSGTTGAAPFIKPEQMAYSPLPRKALRLLDFLVIGQTDSNLLEYARQTARPTNAAAVAESATGALVTKPESTAAYELVQDPIATIAHWIMVARQALADASQLQMWIEDDLLYNLDEVVEEEVWKGPGTTNHLTGIKNQPGINSYTVGAANAGESTVDAIHRGITLVRNDHFEPGFIGMSPNDWQEIRLNRDGNGNLELGPPTMAGDQQLFGKPVVVDALFDDGERLIGTTRQAYFMLREGANVRASDSHAETFVQNITTLLAETRAGLAVPRPAAFAEVVDP